MDVYTGSLPLNEISNEVILFLKEKELTERGSFSDWTGTGVKDFRIISLSDGSQWTLKYYDNSLRFVHIFPASGEPAHIQGKIKHPEISSFILHISWKGFYNRR